MKSNCYKLATLLLGIALATSPIMGAQIGHGRDPIVPTPQLIPPPNRLIIDIAPTVVNQKTIGSQLLMCHIDPQVGTAEITVKLGIGNKFKTLTKTSGAQLSYAFSKSDFPTDGTAQIEVSAIGSFPSEIKKIPITIDTTAPRIHDAIRAVELGGAMMDIPILITDKSPAVAVNITVLNPDGTAGTTTVTVPTGIKTSIRLPTGFSVQSNASIAVTVTDIAGNSATENGRIRVDLAPPLIQSPQSEINTSENTVVTMSISIDDATLPLLKARAIVSTNGLTISEWGLATDGGLQTVTWNISGIPNGSGTLTIEATDKWNQVGSLTLPYQIDRTPPEISGSIFPKTIFADAINPVVTVNLTAADDHKPILWRWVENGEMQSITTSENLTQSLPIDLSTVTQNQANLPIQIVAKDGFGNASTFTDYVTVVNQLPPPDIQIDDPRVSRDKPLKIRLNFSTLLAYNLPNLRAKIEWVQTKSERHSTVIFDDEITSPVIDLDTEIPPQFNGVSPAVADHESEFISTLWVSTEMRLPPTITPITSNQLPAVSIDNQPPDLTQLVLNRQQLPTTKQLSIAIPKGLASGTITIYPKNGEIPLQTTSFTSTESITLSVSSLPTGDYRLIAIGINGYGIMATKSIDFEINAQPVVISAPTSSIFQALQVDRLNIPLKLSKEHVAIFATATDKNGKLIDQDCLMVTTQNIQWLGKTMGAWLPPGIYTIWVTGEDLSGHQTRIKIIVTQMLVPEIATITLLKNNRVELMVESPQNRVIFQLINAETGKCVQEFLRRLSIGAGSLIFPITPLSPGTYRFDYTSTDEKGGSHHVQKYWKIAE